MKTFRFSNFPLYPEAEPRGILLIKKLNTKYDKSLNLGSVNTPSGEYEKNEEGLMFLYKYNPVKENDLYTFTIRDDFDLEEGEEIRFILMLKSNESFEAKIFLKSKGFVSIDYMKGKLKN